MKLPFLQHILLKASLPVIVVGGVGVYAASFLASRAAYRSQKRKERKVRENLSERKVDKMVADSFPASDPPATY